MRKLIMTIGFPRSGKSTWAKQTGFPVVNPDSIRLAIHGQPFIARAEPFVWLITKVMVHSLFLAGHEVVILDATNTTRKRRDEWVSKHWDCVGHVIPTDKATCISRCKDRPDLIPVIEGMIYDPLQPDEDAWS